MAPEQLHILSVPLSDSAEDAYVLINVSSNGPSPLDLKLLATEGTAPYIATIKPSRISKFRSKRNPLTPTDWSTTLQSFLCQHDQFPTSPLLQARDLSKLEASASLSPTDDTLTLHLRHNISGILLSLGSITFTKDESQEIDIFAWCSLSVQHSTALETSIQHLNEQFAEQKETLGKLEQQLEELIQAKKTHEEELLAKFAVLLNEKKLKIREQQRLLAGAKLDPKAAKGVGRAKDEVAKGRTPQPSRKGKRKVAVKDEDEEDEDSFENHRGATHGGPGVEDTDANESEQQADTPDPSDGDVTEDDDNDDDDDDLVIGTKNQDSARKPQSKEPHTPNKPDTSKIQIDSLPPTRTLPFGNHTSNSNANANLSAGKEERKMGEADRDEDKSVLNQEAGNEDDETEGEEDDDEL